MKILESGIPEEMISTSWSIPEDMGFDSLKSLFMKLFAFKKASITTWWAHWSQMKVVGVYNEKAKKAKTTHNAH